MALNIGARLSELWQRTRSAIKPKPLPPGMEDILGVLRRDGERRLYKNGETDWTCPQTMAQLKGERHWNP